jgi:hypothetical protein
MKFFNRQEWGRTLLFTAALAVVGLLGCMITTSGPDDNGGNTTGATGHTHTWGDWAVTTPATCDAQGVEIRTCTQDASHIEARVVAQLTGTACNTGGGDHVHIWGDWTVTIPATCNAQGVETRTCAQDASHKETRVVAQLTGAACNTGGGDHVHTWGDWIVLSPAVCNAPGVEMRRCTQNPNHIDSRVVEQLTGAACNTGGGDHVHTWGNWAVTTPATCNAQGAETRTCTQDASHKETRVIAALTGAACNTGGGDHVHIWGDWVVLSPATCSAAGLETRTCTLDGGHKEVRTIDELTGAACNSGGGDHVHIWGNWVVTTPATCNAQGVETRTCTQDASHKETRPIAQLTGATCNTGTGNGATTKESAILVTVGFSASYNIGFNGEHWFKFVGNGEPVMFETKGNVVDTYINLDGYWWGYDDNSGEGSNALISFNTDLGETYYIKITPQNGTNGVYTFVVTKPTFNIRTNSITVVVGNSSSHTIYAGGTHWFKFVGDGKRTFFETGGNVVNTNISIYKGDDDRALYNGQNGVNFITISGQTYYISIRGNSGTYDFKVYHGTGDGSSQYYAKEVAKGYSATHTINYKGENWFIYQGTGLPVIFETKGNVVDTYINLDGYWWGYDDNSGDGSNALISFDSVLGDNYLIKVTPQSGTSGTYTFIVR